MSRRALLLLGLLPLLTAGSGWRLGGASAALEADLPETVGEPTWSVSLPSWSNASPVAVGDTLFVSAEPTWLYAIDGTTGQVKWKGRHDYVDTLTGEDREAFEARLARYDDDKQAHEDAQRALAKARRRARSAEPPPDIHEQVAARSREVQSARARLDALEQYLTPEILDIIGYASPTPVSDGEVVVAMFGHGVVGAWTLSGEVLWRRWLGPPHTPMQGFDNGSTASPLIVGDTVIVPHGRLRAFDRRTGAPRWEGEAWPHFGSPAATTVGGVDVVLTPGGEAIRVSDGEVLARGLGDVWYVGPVVGGEDAFWVGSFGGPVADDNPIRATRVRLSMDGDELTATQAWSVALPGLTSDVYGAPAFDGDHLYVLTRFGDLARVDADDGTVSATADVAELATHAVYANPVACADGVLGMTEGGRLLRWSRGEGALSPRLLGTVDTTSRATPLPWRGGVVVRGKEWIRGYLE